MRLTEFMQLVEFVRLVQLMTLAEFIRLARFMRLAESKPAELNTIRETCRIHEFYRYKTFSLFYDNLDPVREHKILFQGF